MNKSEPAVADQGGRSAANICEASAPPTSTSKEEHISTRNAHPASAFNGRSSQGFGPGIQHAGDLGVPGKLVIS